MIVCVCVIVPFYHDTMHDVCAFTKRKGLEQHSLVFGIVCACRRRERLLLFGLMNRVEFALEIVHCLCFCAPVQLLQYLRIQQMCVSGGPVLESKVHVLLACSCHFILEL